MSKKTYQVEYGPTWWECTIAIDHSPEVDARIKEMVEHWTGYKGRLADNKGDYTKTFLQDLAREINYIQAEYNYNLEGVIGEFDNRDGYYKMDGTMGITIVDIDDFEMQHSEYVVTEIANQDTGQEAEAE